MKQLFLILILLSSTLLTYAQNGKLFGRITDITTGNPLLTANIELLDTKIGAASIQDGEYLITNIPEGIYKVHCALQGYKPIIIENVRIFTDRSTKLDFQLIYDGKDVWFSKDFETKLFNELPKEIRLKLSEIKQVDSSKYFTLLNQNAATYRTRSGFVLNTKMEDRVEMISSLDLQAEILALQYKKANETEQKVIRNKVEVLLDKLFTLRYEQRKDEIKILESKIEKLKNYAAEYNKNKEEIIKNRIAELLK